MAEKKLKVLMLNGSPRASGNTTIALAEMKKIFAEEGVEVKEVRVGGKPISGCMGCYACKTTGKCVIDDIVNETAPKFAAADGVVIGCPVYFASANGTMIAFLDRLFFSYTGNKTMKVGASVVVARRGGLSATFDELNKFFTVSGMPVASSQYWNSVHGRMPGDAVQDLEGLQVMRTLARNMVFLMKSIALGKETYGLPEKEKMIMTNFVR